MSAAHELVIDWMGRPLTANQVHRMHWAAVGRQRTAWGDAVIQAARIAKLPKLAEPVTVEVWGEYPHARSLPDPDGLSPTLKGVLDGLVRGRFITDDNRLYVRQAFCSPPKVDRSLNRPTLVVRITEADRTARQVFQNEHGSPT